MWNKTSTKKDDITLGVNVGLNELIHLRLHHHQQVFSDKKKKLTLSGQNVTKIRGRGLEFDATREYQPGDDIRHMAWRVTARSLKPHCKVYHEERERPVWLAVDLSPSLFFGTRQMFKSVKIIKEAASLGWQALLKRERIGAMIAASPKMQVYPPLSSERDFLTILNAFSTSSTPLPAFTTDNYLHPLLLTLQQQIRSGNTLFIFSDFFQFDTQNQHVILHLAERCVVTLVFVYDPFEAEPPPPYDYLITDGKERMSFNTVNKQVRLQYEQQFQHKLNELTAFAQKYNIGLQIVCTNKESL